MSNPPCTRIYSPRFAEEPAATRTAQPWAFVLERGGRVLGGGARGTQASNCRRACACVAGGLTRSRIGNSYSAAEANQSRFAASRRAISPRLVIGAEQVMPVLGTPSSRFRRVCRQAPRAGPGIAGDGEYHPRRCVQGAQLARQRCVFAASPRMMRICGGARKSSRAFNELMCDWGVVVHHQRCGPERTLRGVEVARFSNRYPMRQSADAATAFPDGTESSLNVLLR